MWKVHSRWSGEFGQGHDAASGLGCKDSFIRLKNGADPCGSKAKKGLGALLECLSEDGGLHPTHMGAPTFEHGTRMCTGRTELGPCAGEMGCRNWQLCRLTCASHFLSFLSLHPLWLTHMFAVIRPKVASTNGSWVRCRTIWDLSV